MFVEPSESDAEAVRPTRLDVVEFSETVFVSVLESVGAVTSNSSTSEIDMVKFVSAVEPSALAARTTTWHSVAVS